MAITKPGESQSFGYTGGVQSFTAPYDGLYKLEVWGAKGGVYNMKCDTNRGGYSYGYIVLKKGTILYVAVGGAGVNNNDFAAGGFNGGGGGGRASGGGATHIALVNGTIKSIGYTEFVSNKKGLIVAGGGGGSNDAKSSVAHLPTMGAGGGGLTGETGYGYMRVDGGQYLRPGGSGGTQTAGGNPPKDYDANRGTFGEGGKSESWYSGPGGGGGLFGGGPGKRGDDGNRQTSAVAGGGSGYIGGVPAITYKGVTYSPSTSNGVNNGNGSAKITLMEKSVPTTYYGDQSVDALYYGDLEVTGLFFGDSEVG